MILDGKLLQSPTTDNVWNQTTLTKILNGTASTLNDDYWVRYNPAVLAAIAAWTSKVIPFFTGSSMLVIAFFAGRRILDATRNDNPEELPTPHQVSLLINLIQKAAFSPLKDVIMYKWQNPKRLAKPIPAMFAALSSLIFIT